MVGTVELRRLGRAVLTSQRRSRRLPTVSCGLTSGKFVMLVNEDLGLRLGRTALALKRLGRVDLP
jgi:hypothetical protein